MGVSNVDELVGASQEIVDEYRDWYLCSQAEPRMLDCLEQNHLIKIVTPKGSILFMKPKGKMTALCTQVGEGDDFEVGYFYSPTGEELESSRGFYKQYFGLIGQGQERVSRVVEGRGDTWVRMRKSTSLIGDVLESFVEKAEQSIIEVPEIDREAVRSMVSRFEEKVLNAVQAISVPDSQLNIPMEIEQLPQSILNALNNSQNLQNLRDLIESIPTRVNNTITPQEDLLNAINMEKIVGIYDYISDMDRSINNYPDTTQLDYNLNNYLKNNL